MTTTTNRVHGELRRTALALAFSVMTLGVGTAAAQNPPAQPTGAPGYQTNCGWMLDAQNPIAVTHQGNSAGGQSHAPLLVEPQAGDIRALLTSDSLPAQDHNGHTFAKYPPPATLTITMASTQEIRGDLSGLAYNMAALAAVPSQMIKVPVNLIFSARDPSNTQACKGPARIPL